jgi:hypothetical protein
MKMGSVLQIVPDTFLNGQAFQKVRNALTPAGEASHAHGTDSTDVPMLQVHDKHGLANLQNTARDRKNVFAALMEGRRRTRWGRSVIRFMMWVENTGGTCDFFLSHYIRGFFTC